jgi:hypothetical protein
MSLSGFMILYQAIQTIHIRKDLNESKKKR